jgi:hypothetical protein
MLEMGIKFWVKMQPTKRHAVCYLTKGNVLIYRKILAISTG